MLSSYPSKVLLLGEYTILNGSKALALPYFAFEGKWSFEEKQSPDYEVSRQSLRDFLQYGSENYIDHERLKTDVNRGLWFDSSIPHGYGLGSSGALIAAVFQTYGRPSGNLQEDRIALARLEDHFHGSSSGLDPLVSFVKKPLLIHSFTNVEILDSSPELGGFFLLNTRKPRQTGPLVSIYQEKMKDPEFKRGCADVLAKDVDLAIHALTSGERANVFHHLWHISKFQWEFFPEMIPTNVRGAWTRGLESGDYILKLCGAGGGGFVLGMTEKPDSVSYQALHREFEISELR